MPTKSRRKPEMKKMTNEYKILRTKVKELESGLANILSFPPGVNVPKTMVLDFEQLLGFVRNILSAEFASQPSKPNRLSSISAKFNNLDGVFRRWSVGEFDSRDIDDEIGIDDEDDGASTCSPWFNDDGEAENMATVECQRDEEDFKDCLGAEIGEYGTEKRGLFTRGWVRGLMLFVLGLVFICFVGFVILFYGSRFDYYYYYGDRLGFEDFLTPT